MRRLVVLTAAVALVAPATSSAAEQVLDRLYRPAVVSAFNGAVVTSAYDTATKTYQLELVRTDRIEILPVRPRTVPFDVDLGPGPGGTTATYSRCRVEPRHTSPTTSLPDWPTGLGCDIYMLDLITLRERKIAGASTDDASEFLPSVWRNTVAFGRVYERRAGRRSVLPYLYYRNLTAGRSGRLPGDERGDGDLENGPAALDLFGKRLAFVWSGYPLRSDRPGKDRSLTDDRLRLDTIGGTGKIVDRATGSSVNKGISFMAVNADRGDLFYAEECRGDCDGPYNRKFWRYGIANGERALGRLPATTTVVPAGPPGTPAGGQPITTRDVYYSTARDRGVTYAIRGPYDADPDNPLPGGWPLVRLDGPTFSKP
jgi:hypothetical protein